MLFSIRTRFSVLAAAALALVAAAAPADAQRRGERLYILKEVQVDPAERQIEIDMRDTRGAVRALRVRAKRGAIRLSNVRVSYADGSAHDETRNIDLLSGERTRPMDVTRTNRFVDTVTLFVDADWLANRTSPRRVTMQVLGHQTRRGRRARRPQDPAPVASSEAREQKTAAAATEKTETATPAATARPEAVLEVDETTGRGEVLFGAQRVGLGLDRDVIRVSPNIGRFRRVRMRVLENDIFLRRITVNYSDGTSEAHDVEAEVAKGSVTGWIDLAQARFISNVELDYRSKANFKGRARVEIFGDFAEGWLGPEGKGRNFNDGWVLLGAQTAGFVGFDNDVVPVGRNKGGFRQVRIRVRDRAITLNEMRIIYPDGRSDTVPIKARVDAGSAWGPIDLEGRSKPIKEIRARYRSRFFDRNAVGKGAAIVEVWGRY
ncbi:MAG: DUF2541 domain-containing protein [Pseudomonadota bacterium]